MRNGTSPVYSAAGPAEALALRDGPPQAVRAALLAARERTLALAQDFLAALGPVPRLPLAPWLNPPLWEWGHVGWFQEWWLARNPQRSAGVRADPDAPRPPSRLPEADRWYDSGRVAHRTRWDLPLPGADDTLSYLRATLEDTLELLDALPAEAGGDALYFFRLAVLHEQMHAEAAAMIAQHIGIPLRESVAAPTAEARGEIDVPAGSVRLGTSEHAFAFDNELGPHTVEVGAFTMDAEPVTWARFLPFVEAGGYAEPRWWSPQGRAWLAEGRRQHPGHLRTTASGWEQLRGGAWQPLRPAEVALHLSAWEAEAWCRWAGRRLPTEGEWECAMLTQPGFRWGHGWEWTASAFAPYPGFQPHPYRDYSQPWFGSRRVLRGASPATAPALAHARYRNFFEPHRDDVFAGFRSVRAQAPVTPSAV